MVQKKRRKQSDARVEAWLVKYRRQRILLLWLGSLGTAILAVPVLYVTWNVIWFVLLFAFLMVVPLENLSTVTWVIWALLFVAHATANWQRLENFKFESEGKLVAARYAAYISGVSSLALVAGPETMHSFVKLLCLILLIGPSLIALSFKLARAAIAAQRMDVLLVAAALKELLVANQRVLLDDLVTKVRAPHPPQLLRELLLIDGVILLTSGDPSLTVTDSLRADVSARSDEAD